MQKQTEVLVKATNVSKKFCRNLKTGMRYGVADISRAMFGIRSDKTRLRKDEFWAVKGIDFELRRGECLGLIGRNGAGKSTLLKMLNGLITPDEGSIVMHGRVGALIELGAGFNPLLTGRENIYINGQLLGFTKQEIREKFDKILQFAEIAEFIDTPVQNYSSGMKVRLGFAIASQMEPDVLIIDEVLAVGDLGFVLKCFNTIDKLLANTAVIFVSHSMPQVSRICTNIMMLERGVTTYNDTDIAKGIDLYYSKFTKTEGSNIVFQRDGVELLNLNYDNHRDPRTNEFLINRLEDLSVSFLIRVPKSYAPFLVVTIFDKEQRPVGVCITDHPLSKDQIVANSEDYNDYKSNLMIPRINLAKGLYSISLSVNEGFRSKPLLRVQLAATFQVISFNDVWQPIEFEAFWS
jgi:lipopolysaccharide transport system ATP-binding protein